MRKLFVLIMAILMLSALSCMSPQATSFKEALTKIADNTPLPTYYDQYTGEPPHNVWVFEPDIRFDTSTGTPTAKVSGHLDWGFWHTGKTPTVWLVYDGTFDLHPDMLAHPEKFYWVIAQ